ncbi:hypothetical protein [Pantoea sp. CCBC3-3-1]|uniref:hypothetical protein n=1 Tax=Pantoea sp. CCBC3-3-1 TaxID=2490851 RepID=UPI0011BD70C6|nr:hypothetical protein [Pantoea sp. CCBC3-3-1]
MATEITTSSAKFTAAARDALDWGTSKMTEAGYLAFKAEMEKAAAAVIRDYGMDDVLASFDVSMLFDFKR